MVDTNIQHKILASLLSLSKGTQLNLLNYKNEWDFNDHYIGKHGDALKFIQEQDTRSIDMIFTDPPYGIGKAGIPNDENLYVWQAILPELYRVLADDCFLVFFASIGNLNKFIKLTDECFKYRWQYILYINNTMVSGGIGFSKYATILIYQKGNAKIKNRMRDLHECSTSSKENAKRVHPTEKRLDVCLKLIDGLSKPNDWILDPFAGSGVIPAAALMKKRKTIFYELNKKYFGYCTDRIKLVWQHRQVLGIKQNLTQKKLW